MKISKIEAATLQLDWAIRLFLDHGEWLPAVTLCGAAEEVLGKAVEDHAAFSVLKTSLAAKYSTPEAVVSREHLNKVRNWLKHWKDYPADEHIEVEPLEEAVQCIGRALSNLFVFDRSLPSQGLRFLAWLDDHPKFGPLEDEARSLLDKLNRENA